MSNVSQVLADRFIVFPKEGIVQAAFDTPVDNADITQRDKLTFTHNRSRDIKPVLNCRDEDQVDELIRSQFDTLTLNYAEVSDEIISRWTALFLGTAAAPTGTPANEVQTLTVTADGTIAMTLEGRTITTRNIPSGSTAAQIQAYLTAPRMTFIHPGDVIVTGGSSPFTLTFPDTGRLGRANLPLMAGTGGMAVTASANGDQNSHDFTRSTLRAKQLVSFCVGWETDPTRVEKYINFAVNKLTPNFQRNGDLGLAVELIGMWDLDSIEASFDIPDCYNVTPMPTSDCGWSLNGTFQTNDINTVSIVVADNIPTDPLSAFGFDGIDLQRLHRSTKPAYTFDAEVLGSEVDTIYSLAKNELTQAPVATFFNFGMPGHRCTWFFDYAKLSLQSDPIGNVGTDKTSTVKIKGIGFADKATNAVPFRANAKSSQTAQFLQT